MHNCISLIILFSSTLFYGHNLFYLFSYCHFIKHTCIIYPECNKFMMSMVSNTISSFSNFLGRFMVLKIQSCSIPKLITAKGYQPKSAEGRTHGKNFKANKVHIFKSPFLVELCKMPLIPPAMSCDMCESYLLEMVIRDSFPKYFAGDWPCRHCLLSMYQNFRLR